VVGANVEVDWSECRYTVPLVDSGGRTRWLKARGVEYTVYTGPTVVPPRIADVIASMASSHSGRAHLKDCVLKGKEELFGWRVGEHEMSVTLSEHGGAPKYDGTDDIFIKIHLDSIPESIITGRHPTTPQVPDRPPVGDPPPERPGLTG
jgi:hypothetical protein